MDEAIQGDGEEQRAVPEVEAEVKKEGPSPMELSSMPLDPIYAWGIVLEPVEVMIERTSDFVEQLARETYRRGEPFSDEVLEERFLAFFHCLVEEGTLRRLPDAPPEMGRRILGPGRWLKAQRIRIQRLIAYWEEQSAS
jgi:hypothetical protein